MDPGQCALPGTALRPADSARGSAGSPCEPSACSSRDPSHHPGMEPLAEAQTETFSYVVRAPGADGADIMDVKVKIDTRWVLQEGEEGEEGLPEDTPRGPPSDLQSRVRELERSEARLLRRVERLRARLAQERSHALRAQEQLRALRGALARQVQEQERAVQQRRRLRELVRRQDAALGQQAAALERGARTQRHQLGLARRQERALRAQVQRLQGDVRRLCRAAGLLLAELDAPGPLAPTRHGPGRPAHPRSASPEARAGPGARRLREREGRARGQLCGQLEGLQLSDIRPSGRAPLPPSLQDERSAAPEGHGHREEELPTSAGLCSEGAPRPRATGQLSGDPCPSGHTGAELPGCLACTQGMSTGAPGLDGEAAAALSSEPDPQGRESHRSLQLAEGASAWAPRWASPPAPASSSCPAQDPADGFAELEACFRQLWEQGRGEGASPGGASSACPGAAPGQLGRQDCTWLAQARGGSLRWRSPGVQQGETEALGTGQVLPGGFCELGLSGLSPPPTAPERLRTRFHELISALKTEQRDLWQENAQLRRDGERSLQKLRALEQEREGAAAATGALGSCRRELAQALQAVSDLEDCSQRSYRRITQLEAAGERLRRAVSERAGACRGAVARLRRGQRELRALVSQLGASHQELMRDLAAGIEGAIGAFPERHARPRRRDPERGARAEGTHWPHPCGRSRTRLGAVGVAAGAHGLLVEDRVDGPRGRLSPAPSMESSGGAAQVSEGLGAPWQAEKDPASGAADPGLRRWVPEATSSPEQELRLCVRRLQLQVGTLRCQLRDQGTALEASRQLRAQLQGQLGELQEKHREASLAVAPLKAKLASLVRKCQERNRLLSALLRELHRHAPAGGRLEASVQSMLRDAALAQYAAAFRGPRETRSELDAGAKEEDEDEDEEEEQDEAEEDGEQERVAACLSAQTQWVDAKTHVDVQRPAGSWPAPKAAGPVGPGAPQGKIHPSRQLPGIPRGSRRGKQTRHFTGGQREPFLPVPTVRAGRAGWGCQHQAAAGQTPSTTAGNLSGLPWVWPQGREKHTEARS
ncbi:uncharacterized protein LOC101537407 isoform X3 [Sorex araneus]|uniref:uncharacterized protein LOC101537407 isoform X3 n=1 Tax=Sorex araneus TaxID=42254 RepID=UPI002433A6D0|nr:uncharacterized protein LOC101537407 isoform X3 [Sorex araneus]